MRGGGRVWRREVGAKSANPLTGFRCCCRHQWLVGSVKAACCDTANLRPRAAQEPGPVEAQDHMTLQPLIEASAPVVIFNYQDRGRSAQTTWPEVCPPPQCELDFAAQRPSLRVYTTTAVSLQEQLLSCFRNILCWNNGRKKILCWTLSDFKAIKEIFLPLTWSLAALVLFPKIQFRSVSLREDRSFPKRTTRTTLWVIFDY